jgi:hypothetical protein
MNIRYAGIAVVCGAVGLAVSGTEPAMAGPQPQVTIQSRFVEVSDHFSKELGIGFSGMNGCQSQGDLQRVSLGEIPSFAESAGSSIGSNMLGSMMGGGMSVGMGGGGSPGGLGGSSEPFGNVPDRPHLSKNPFTHSLSPGFPFADGTQIQLQLEPSLYQAGPKVDAGNLFGGSNSAPSAAVAGIQFGIRINQPAVKDKKFTIADAVLVGPDCKRHEPSGRLVFKVYQQSTFTWSVEYWRWRDEVLQEHWLKTGSQSWMNEIGSGALPLWIGVRFDGVTPEMLSQGGWSLVTGWTYEAGNQIMLQPRVFDLLPDTTQVRMKNGQTMALGGLQVGEKQTPQGKVPMLGDIPFVGELFRQKETAPGRDLMVMVTPRVIDEF